MDPRFYFENCSHDLHTLFSFMNAPLVVEQMEHVTLVQTEHIVLCFSQISLPQI